MGSTDQCGKMIERNEDMKEACWQRKMETLPHSDDLQPAKHALGRPGEGEFCGNDP